jgi:rhodanese-related sulfurtransferase
VEHRSEERPDVRPQEMHVPTIARDALKKKIDRAEKFLLVETLSPASYAKGHLPGAINLPPDRLGDLAAQVLPDKTAEIVVYCASPT